MPPVRPLTPDLFPSAASLLAEAFFTNPPHVYICPNDATRYANLEWLLGANLRLQPDLGTSFCVVEDGKVNAMGFWTRSSAPKIGMWAKIRVGILAAPIRLGWRGFRRLFEVTDAVELHLAEAFGDRPFVYLNNMVVRQHLRGTGVGTRLLREQLGVVSAANPDAIIALSTQRPENVTFYDRLGFRVVLDEVVGKGATAFRSWIMMYSPGTLERTR
jgi:GNAT superfamily N-acetyltransferase